MLGVNMVDVIMLSVVVLSDVELKTAQSSIVVDKFDRKSLSSFSASNMFFNF
jgi:hypothetical protein